ncbi:putative signal transduction histidine kinase with GAF domain [Erythrobacter sp. SD-21]|nr:putative signal transduction histidine kinase with GAF domain [Erythrobacter sp. SD-21]
MRALNLRLAFEREQTLRREVDHRVKNSLASISSIITMKARRSPDEGTRTALEDIGLRIRSLASLHEQLQDVGAHQTVDLVVLFERVGTDLRQLLPQGVDLDIRVTGRQVAPALANSLLLIVNEFVSNSVKHGLSKKGGNISIAIDAGTAGDNWSIVCKDTGDASAQDAQRAAQSSGLGTRVIHSIARGLDAQVEFSADGGGMKLAVRK